MADKKPLITGKVRFSYVHVFTPTAVNEGDPEKYSVSLIIPKDDKKTKAKIDRAVKAAFDAGKEAGTFTKRTTLKSLKTPLRDGDDERPDDPAYEDSYFLNASSNRKPEILKIEDGEYEEVLTRDEFYSGCYGKASLVFFAYNKNGGKGIAAALNNLLKLEDGEPLGATATSAYDDFAEDLEDLDEADADDDVDPLM